MIKKASRQSTVTVTGSTNFPRGRGYMKRCGPPFAFQTTCCIVADGPSGY